MTEFEKLKGKVEDIEMHDFDPHELAKRVLDLVAQELDGKPTESGKVMDLAITLYMSLRRSIWCATPLEGRSDAMRVIDNKLAQQILFQEIEHHLEMHK